MLVSKKDLCCEGECGSGGRFVLVEVEDFCQENGLR